MQEKKTKPYRYWLAYLLEDLEAGEEFKPGLLHVTIIPWFVLETDEQELIGSFIAEFSGLSSFDAKVGEQINFGPNSDVPVSLLEPSLQIESLHIKALHWFDKIGARWAVKRPHVGEEFKAHIRRRQGTKIDEDDILRINSLTLVRASRREDNIRQVAAKVEWDEKSEA